MEATETVNAVETVEPGDWVVYIDSDQAKWGPWSVLSVSGNELIVRVENQIQISISPNWVKKLKYQNM